MLIVSVLSLAVRNVWLISGLSGGKLEKTVADEVHLSPRMIHLPEDEKKHSQILLWVAQGMYTVATYWTSQYKTHWGQYKYNTAVVS